MYKLILSAIIFFVIFASCNTTGSDSSVNIDQNIRLVFRDTSGNNLLNPHHPNAITEKIRTYIT